MLTSKLVALACDEKRVENPAKRVDSFMFLWNTPPRSVVSTAN